MRYPCVIEPSNGKAEYGVIFPDLTGCYATGASLDDALRSAKEAAVLWLEEEIEDGRDIPSPSTFEKILENKDWKGWILGFVDIDLSKITGKTIRLNICLPSKVVRRIDSLAAKRGESRSSYIASLAMQAR